MKGLRIGRRRARNGLPGSPLEHALLPALTDDRWHVPDRFNFTRDVVEALASDPKRRAVTFLGPDGVIEPRTFMQIAEGAGRWASVIREHGVQPNDRVIVLAGTSVDWLEIVLGVIKIGAVTVPCSPTISAAALEVRASATEATLVVAEHSCRSTIEQMSFTPDVHYLDEGRHRGASDDPVDSPTHATSSRDLAFILPTPGTGGAPKGVAHTHGSLFATRVAAEHWLDAGRGDSVWCTAESDSAHALWSGLVGPWSRGAEIVVHQGEFDPLERLDLIYRLGPTILCQSPAEYRVLAGLRELERFRSPRLRRLVSTGDHLEPEIIAAFEERWGMTIHDGYGQAETNTIVANGAEAEFKPGSIGRPLPGHQVAIVDGEGNELPAGIEGDLAVRGRPPTLFAGYWESPDETKSAFRGDWYLTGDVAIADEDGFFWFVGRAEDVITSRGRTFGPYEVEHVLREHDAIAASAVVGIRDLQRGGQFIRAYVVPTLGSEGSEQLEAEIRQFAGQALPEQQVPREIVFVEELPTVRGTVSRHTLRERPIGGRPLWDLPPTSEPEPAPMMTQPEPAPTVVAEAAPVMEPQPIVRGTPEPVAQPVESPEPVAPPTPEPIEIPEPVAEVAPRWEPVGEAALELEPSSTLEPRSAAPLDPEPVALPEAAPVVVPEPEPVARALPEPEPEPEPVPIVEPEPPEPTPTADASAPEPEHTPEFSVAPVPEARPDFVIEPSSEPDEPKRVPKPEPEPTATAPEPLPDFIVPPGPTPELPPPPPRAPEPEPDLGPLPDYVVDPDRPPDPKPRAPEPKAPAATPKPSLEVAAKSDSEPSPASSAGLYFPPVTSFPAPRDDADEPGTDNNRSVPKAPRRRPAPDAGKPKRSQAAEPGDEAEEVNWMQGLSNRLSAYSLAEQEANAADEPAEDKPDDTEST